MPHCLISLGSNQGDSRAILANALELLRADSAIELNAVSGWHITQPVGGPPGQGAFVNGAATLTTALEPQELLRRLQQIEAQLGRQRVERWGPRTLDLDLLLYDQRTIASPLLTVPLLTVPHPRMAFRRFVLAPAIEIAADWIHPGCGCSLQALWERLPNDADPLGRLAVAGADDAQCRRLADQIAVQTSGASCSSPVPPDPQSFAEVRDWWQATENELSGTLNRPQSLPVLVASFSPLEILQACTTPPGELEQTGNRWSGWRALSEAQPAFRQQVATWMADSPPVHLVLDLGSSLSLDVSERGCVPVLAVPSDDEQLALSEATAAVQAMRPD